MITIIMKLVPLILLIPLSVRLPCYSAILYVVQIIRQGFGRDSLQFVLVEHPPEQRECILFEEPPA